MNPTLYKLESAGKVLKDSTSKPRWKAVLPSSDGAFQAVMVFLGVKIFLMPLLRENICAYCLKKRKCYCDAGRSRSDFLWRMVKSFVGRWNTKSCWTTPAVLQRFLNMFEGFKDVVVYLFDFSEPINIISKKQWRL